VAWNLGSCGGEGWGLPEEMIPQGWLRRRSIPTFKIRMELCHPTGGLVRRTIINIESRKKLVKYIAGMSGGDRDALVDATTRHRAKEAAAAR
jgi:hypothetical protein